MKGCELDIPDRYGGTALHQSAHEGHLEVTKALIDGHANINVQDHRGVTPLLGKKYDNKVIVGWF